MIVEVALVGHLSKPVLASALQRATEPAPGLFGLLCDCLGMSSYDMDAREAFVAWNRDYRERVAAVAIVTEKTLWHMVVSTMSMASGQRMRAFRKPDDARRWLESEIRA